MEAGIKCEIIYQTKVCKGLGIMASVGDFEPKNLTDTLWVNLFFGYFGADRMFAGAAWSGILKLIVTILVLPLGLIWNFLDSFTLVAGKRFLFGPTVKWRRESPSAVKLHILGVSILKLVLIGLLIGGTVAFVSQRSVLARKPNENE